VLDLVAEKVLRSEEEGIQSKVTQIFAHAVVADEIVSVAFGQGANIKYQMYSALRKRKGEREVVV
jgi:transposase-like protein